MTGLGLTKYGFGVDYNVAADTRVNRTYNGINFSSDTAADKAKQLSLFVKGQYIGDEGTPFFAEGSLSLIAGALGMSINGFEIIQRNTVSDDA